MRGYTLIELIVTMAIVMLLSGGVITAIKDFQDRQSAKNEVGQVVSYLRETQKKSTAVEVPTSCLDRLSGYVVEMENRKIIIRPDCSGGINREIDLSKVTFCSPYSIRFSIPEGTTTETNIELCGDDEKRYTVYVSVSGTVSDPQ